MFSDSFIIWIMIFFVIFRSIIFDSYTPIHLAIFLVYRCSSDVRSPMMAKKADETNLYDAVLLIKNFIKVESIFYIDFVWGIVWQRILT